MLNLFYAGSLGKGESEESKDEVSKKRAIIGEKEVVFGGKIAASRGSTAIA